MSSEPNEVPAMSELRKRIVQDAIRGRTESFMQPYLVGGTGVSITCGHAGRLGERAIMLCATGAQNTHAIVRYSECPSNNVLRERVANALRAVVQEAEGMSNVQ